MALGLHHSGLTNLVPDFIETADADVELGEEGTIILRAAVVDKGQGAGSTLAAIAADTLGVGLERVVIERPDANSPYDPRGAEASRTTYVVGRAVADACTTVREAILRAAEELEPATAAHDIVDGVVVDAAGHSITTLGDLARAGVRPRASGTFLSEDQDPLPVIGADFCEVEVDLETGYTRVLRFVAAQDVGRVISVLGCEGQIEGGIHHGIGYALTEGLEFDEGQPINGDFANYRLLMAPEMPEIIPLLIEEPDMDGGPFGAKGLGTGVIPAIAPAVCNAIRDATGVRPRELPVTPARLLELLNRANDSDRAVAARE